MNRPSRFVALSAPLSPRRAGRLLASVLVVLAWMPTAVAQSESSEAVAALVGAAGAGTAPEQLLAQARGSFGGDEGPGALAGALNEVTDAEQRGTLRYVLGALLSDRGRDLEAVEAWTRAAGEAPRLGAIQLRLGNALVRLERGDEAVSAYRELIRIEPKNLEARLRLGVALKDLGRIDESIATFEAARDPSLDGLPADRVGAAYFLAELLRGTGRLEEAVPAYRDVLALDGQAVPALAGLAASLGQLGRYGEAAGAYEELVLLNSKDARAHLGLATSLILAEEHQKAKERLEDALAAVPDSLDLKDVLARHLAACPDRSVRDGKRALALAEDLYQEVPTPESLETLAMAYAEAGEYEKAARAQEHLMEEGKDAPEETLRRWTKNLNLYRLGQPCCG